MTRAERRIAMAVPNTRFSSLYLTRCAMYCCFGRFRIHAASKRCDRWRSMFRARKRNFACVLSKQPEPAGRFFGLSGCESRWRLSSLPNFWLFRTGLPFAADLCGFELKLQGHGGFTGPLQFPL